MQLSKELTELVVKLKQIAKGYKLLSDMRPTSCDVEDGYYAGILDGNKELCESLIEEIEKGSYSARI